MRNKKLTDMLLIGVSLFYCGEQINAMLRVNKLPIKIVQKKFEMFSQDKKNALEKAFAGAKEARLQSAQEELKRRRGQGEVYLYDEKTGAGQILGQEIVAKSITLKNQRKDLGFASFSSPVDYSQETIKNLFKLVTRYSQCRAMGEKNCKEQVRKAAQALPLSQLVSAALLANHLDIKDNLLKEIAVAIGHAVYNKTDFTHDGISALESVNTDVGNQVFSWDLLLTKIKAAVIKSKQGLVLTNFIQLEPSPVVDESDQRINKLSFNSLGSIMIAHRGLGSYMVDFRTNYLRTRLSNHNTVMPVWVGSDSIAYLYNGDPSKISFMILEDTSNTVKNNGLIDLKQCNNDLEFDKYVPLSMLIDQDSKKIICSYGLLKDHTEVVGYGIGIWTIDNSVPGFCHFLKEKQLIRPEIIFYSDKLLLLVDYRPEKVTLHALSSSDYSLLHTQEFSSIYDRDESRSVISANGQTFACTGEKGSVYIQQISIDNVKKVFESEPLHISDVADVLSLALSPDNRMLMVGSKNKIMAYDTILGNKLGEFIDKRTTFTDNYSLAFSPDGTQLVVGGKGYGGLAQNDDPNRVPDSIFRAQLIPAQYKEVLEELNRTKPLSFIERVLVNQVIEKSYMQGKPILLDQHEKKAYRNLPAAAQKMLVDIGIVAPGQQRQPAEKLVPQEGFWQKIRNARISVESWLDYFNKKLSGLPGSG